MTAIFRDWCLILREVSLLNSGFTDYYYPVMLGGFLTLLVILYNIYYVYKMSLVSYLFSIITGNG